MKKQFSAQSSVGLLILALVSIALGVYIGSQPPSNSAPEFTKLVLLPQPKPLNIPDFTTHKNQLLDGKDLFSNKWSVIFFGYTYCPDICPTTLKILRDVKQNLVEQGIWQHFQFLMITVDPKRDTAAQLNNYVPFFDSEFIGLTAQEQSIAEFAKSVGVLFFAQDADATGRYDVDHSASLIILNPNGEWAGALTAPHNEVAITRDLVSLANFKGLNSLAHDGTKTPPSSSVSNTPTALNTRLSISNAWIRPSPPNAPTRVAYFDISNTSEQMIEIVASNSPDFDLAMIHDTTIIDGIAKMQHLDTLKIPANSTVSLKPLGKHLMLIQPTRTLTLGDAAQITLTSDQGEKFTTTITVQEPQ